MNKIPNGWKEYNLSKIGISYGGLRNKKAKSFSENCNAKYITYKSIYDSDKIDINRLGNVFVDKNENQNLVKYGDVFFTISSETPNEVAMSSVLLDEVENTYLNSFCFGFRFDFNILLPEFARYYFRSDYIRKSTYRLAQGITRYNISKNKFLDIVIHLPPLEEQKRIASALSKIDAYLENTIKLIEEKERFKKGISKKLLTCKDGENVPEMRFKEFNDKWETVKLGDMFDNFIERNNEDKIILASTRDKGVIPNSLTERKIIRKKESLSNYKLVKKGCFVISLMSFQGGFEYSDYEGIISPAYTVLKPKIEMSHYFYKYYFKSYKFIKDLRPYAEGIRHGKQIKFNACKNILIPYPSIKEQEEISKFLSLLDAEIDNLKEQKEEIKKMKSGIINKLISGKIRIDKNLD